MSENKEQKVAEAKTKTVSGTEQEKEKSAWEKAAETIAGDNKLMGVAMKILLSPLTLLAGAGLIVYCFFEIRKRKEEIEKLKTENKAIRNEKQMLDDDYEKVKKKYKKLKALHEPENEIGINGLDFLKQNVLPQEKEIKKTYQTSYLD